VRGINPTSSRHRAGVGPLQIDLGRGTNGRRAGLEEIADDQQLVGMEQSLGPFVFGVLLRVELLALIGVAKQLVDRLGNGCLDARALEFRHHQRDAVHEQNCIRNDVASSAGQLYLELVDDQKVIVLRVVEIDVAQRLLATGVPSGQTIGHRTLEQQFGNLPIRLHQTQASGQFQLPNCPLDARIIQPGPPVRAEVDLVQRLGQPILEQHLTEICTLGEFGDISVTDQPLPAHLFELLTEGLLDQQSLPFNLVVSAAVSHSPPCLLRSAPVQGKDQCIQPLCANCIQAARI
jgi:hypothetical protein